MDLPNSWLLAKIEDVTLPFATYNPKSTPESQFTYVDIGAIDNSCQKITSPKFFYGKDAPSRARRLVKAGDVLFSTVRTYLKNIARVPEELDGVLTSTGIAILRPSSFLEQDFLFHIVSSDSFIISISSRMDGTLYPAVTDKDLASAKIPLPPLNEQRRIVTKIEELTTHSRRAREALDDVPGLIEQFRQSVLAAAFRGDLTADWREKNPDVEPAEKLLERIREARSELAKQTRDKRRLEKDWETLSLAQDCKLPRTWLRCAIGHVGNVCNGSTPSRKNPNYWNGSISWISSGEVQNNMIQGTKEKITKEGFESSSVRILPAGTVLIAMIGEGKTRGQTAVLEIESTINQNIAAVILDHCLLSSKYLWHWFQYQYAETRRAGSGSGPQALNCQRVREMPFVLPPLLEQERIVQIIDELLGSFCQIQSQHKKSLEDLNLLDQSILAKAFRGDLVPQDPNDEPASALLDRIRAEREKLGTTKKRRRKKPKQDPPEQPSP